jgi:hypothetical protein
MSLNVEAAPIDIIAIRQTTKDEDEHDEYSDRVRKQHGLSLDENARNPPSSLTESLQSPLMRIY